MPAKAIDYLPETLVEIFPSSVSETLSFRERVLVARKTNKSKQRVETPRSS
jgi:hypothetical protein